MRVATGLIMVAVASSAFAGPAITSKTTGLYPSKACKTKIAGQDGSDPVLRCPAMNGYDVEVSFSAIDTHVALTGDNREIKFSGNVGNKLEWRIAGGKPFAVLVEVADNDTDDNGKSIRRNARIEIEGLGGHDLHAKVEIKGKDTKRAWIAARALADAAVPATTK